TLSSLAKGDCPYITPELAAGFDLYLSFTGGRALQVLEQRYGARAARVLYCSVDPDRHKPAAPEPIWEMGYLGTYSADRQPGLETIFVPGRHILVVRSSDEVLDILREFPDRERRQLAIRAREHVLARHTAAHRALALEGYVEELLGRREPRRVAAAG